MFAWRQPGTGRWSWLGTRSCGGTPGGRLSCAVDSLQRPIDLKTTDAEPARYAARVLSANMDGDDGGRKHRGYGAEERLCIDTRFYLTNVWQQALLRAVEQLVERDDRRFDELRLILATPRTQSRRTIARPHILDGVHDDAGEKFMRGAARGIETSALSPEEKDVGFRGDLVDEIRGKVGAEAARQPPHDWRDYFFELLGRLLVAKNKAGQEPVQGIRRHHRHTASSGRC